jgi:hypothetical protein
MDPITALFMAVTAAKTTAQATAALDKYARVNGLTREEALRQLLAEGTARGDDSLRVFAGDYRAHLVWQSEHPFAATAVRVADPTGLGSAAARSARRWLQGRPSA